GWDDQGTFTIRYGPDGVKWRRGWPEGVPSPSAVTKSAVSGGIPQIEAAARIIEAVAALGQWYEMHQFRKLSEAQHEERRIQWLMDYIELFVETTAGSAQIDAKATFYLSRETERLFEALVTNPKMDVPSSLLYFCSIVQRQLADF